MDKKGWKEIPRGGIIDSPGTAVEYKTGGWRTYYPSRDEEACTDCLQCWIHCPDSSILVSDGSLTGFDYDHCKGCGICASVCPVECIEMKEEGQ